ncbi:MAG: hypothetical protein ACI8UX_001398, partial [Psychromonas sp.]
LIKANHLLWQGVNCQSVDSLMGIKPPNKRTQEAYSGDSKKSD